MSTTLVAPRRRSTAAVKPLAERHSRLPSERFAFIDALRGLAALAVAVHHITRFGPLCDPAWETIPDFCDPLFENGRLGVRIFFVISGFVIAYSVRKAWVTPQYLGNFALRRSIRLEPPYWATILIVVVLNQIAKLLTMEPPNPDPTWAQAVAHLFYLQGVFGMENISIGFWTLCIELQFYLSFVILVGVAQRVSRYFADHPSASAIGLAIVFLPAALWSLFHSSLVDETLNHMWVSRYFWSFFLGALACWTLDGKTPPALWWAFVGVVVARLGVDSSPAVMAALLTGLAVYAAGRLGRLGTWLNFGWLKYLGKTSYSLYLIHYPVAFTVMNFGFWATGNASVPAVLWMFVALAASIGAAHLLYVLVEAPSVRWAKKLQTSDHKATTPQAETSGAPALQY